MLNVFCLLLGDAGDRRDRYNLLLVRNEVAGKDLNEVLCRSYNRRHIQTYMDCTSKQPLLFDLITRQAEGKERADDWNGFDQSLRNSPSTGPDYSVFHSCHLLSDQTTNGDPLPTLNGFGR